LNIALSKLKVIKGAGMVDNNVWTKKYEPKELNEMILHPVVRNKLENIFKTPQNVTLYGKSGVGKPNGCIR
jgi:hypothetical protein